jgi:hypothetical protein
VSASRARLLLVGLLVSFMCLCPPTASAPALPQAVSGDPWAETPETLRLRERARDFRRIARRWARVIGKPRPVLDWSDREFSSLYARRLYAARRWYAKALSLREAAQEPPHEYAWRCIHRYEGPWDDPNAPYYGGLQMDLAFQRTYGRWLLRRKGTANRWLPVEQMWVAERALRAGRGFYPWPVSARRCGLI